MAGLTDQGLEIKRLTEIREELRAEAGTLFNDILPEGDILDTSSASTLGRLIGLVTPSQSDIWEAIQQVYSAFDPNAASGVALDNLVALSGIVRKGAVATTARVLLEGDYNLVIPESSLVSSSFTNNRFSISSDITLDENNVVGFSCKVQTVQNSTLYTVVYKDSTNNVDLSYTSSSTATEVDILQGLADSINDNYGTLLTATVEADTLKIVSDDLVTQTSYELSSNLYFFGVTKTITSICTEVGPISQNPRTINTISTPIFGWNSVVQPLRSVVGSNRETDAVLRQRFSDGKFTRGSNIIEALYSDLVSLDGVQETVIYENITDVVDSRGIPPHSFMVLVRGGLEKEIAELIWANRPAGIRTHGNTFFLITDIFDNLKEVYFQRPKFVDIFVTLDVTVDSNFPPDGVEQIRSALFDYIKSNTVVGKGTTYSRLYTPINSVAGHQVDSLFLGLSVNPTGTENVTIAYDELVKLEIGNIEVNAI
jgi:uncharacterized phage protein gp47/JayE